MATKIPSIDEHMLAWFRQYGSHVILHRAVPHIHDGLKPSQRRVLHSLNELEDGRYNKVANAVGNTLKYHPHGDASVFETMVGIAQKGFLIDTQGNWGNTLTGDGAAAARYIEGRLSPLAKEFLFNPKTTEWQDSYDGRNKEPVALPAKLPLLLIQGTEGIAVSLACKIPSHNLGECCDAAIAHLSGQEFTLLPDFTHGGIMDVSAYDGGKPGGKIRIRAKIEREKNNLIITEIPFGTTTTSIRDSILKAEEKGSVKIKKVTDMTSDTANIVVEFPAGTDMDMAEEALYSFTDCEVSHTINPIVIRDSAPAMLSIPEILRASVDRTKELIRKELEIELAELHQQWHRLSLERIFIETKAYLELETAKDETEAIQNIRKRMAPRLDTLREQPTDEDIQRLTELKIRRISRYDSDKAARDIAAVEAKEKVAKKKLKHLTETVIEHFQHLKEKHGRDPRRTVISEGAFGKIKPAAVAAASQKIFWDPANGFIGTGLKKTESEALPFEINPMTDVAAIGKNGVMKICRPGAKTFYTENLLDARIVGAGGEEVVYHMIYHDKASATTYAKKFSSKGGFTRERPYPLAGGSEENEVLFLQVTAPGKNPKPVLVELDPNCSARKKEVDFDFEPIAVKGRESQGNIVTKYPVKKITSK